jgi:hypothetical protein
MTVQVNDIVDFALYRFPVERRRTQRFRFDVVMPAVLARGDALILDISSGGARVMHFAPQAIRNHVRLLLVYGGRRFSVTATVLATRVAGLGNGPGGATSYESRLRFAVCAADAAQTLEQIIAQIETDRLAESASRKHHRDDAQYFTRCQHRGRQWAKCWTRDPAQPDDGFTVPAKLSDAEVDMLCEAYARMDKDGRELIRATAAMAS